LNSAATAGQIVFKGGTGEIRSDGYNVVDVDFGTGATQCGWTAGTGDKKLSELSITLPFTGDGSTFDPAIKVYIVPTGTSGFPEKDFNGNVRSASATGGLMAAGALK
jgi:hypothetical protein